MRPGLRSSAQEAARTFEAAIRAERLRYAPTTLTRGAWQAALALLLVAVALWMLRRALRWARARIERWCERRLQAMGARRLGERRVRSMVRAMGRLVFGVHVVIVIIVLDAFLTYTLGLFPWTRAAASRLTEYAMTPVRAVVTALIDYLPDFFFLIVITAVFYGAIRIVNAIASQVKDGHIVLANFPAEWADPTRKIIRFLLVALGVVVAFPYLPASSSSARSTRPRATTPRASGCTRTRPMPGPRKRMSRSATPTRR